MPNLTPDDHDRLITLEERLKSLSGQVERTFASNDKALELLAKQWPTREDFGREWQSIRDKVQEAQGSKNGMAALVGYLVGVAGIVTAVISLITR